MSSVSRKVFFRGVEGSNKVWTSKTSLSVSRQDFVESVSTKCRLQTEYKMQTEFKMQTDKKNCFSFLRQKRDNIRFHKLPIVTQ